MGNQDTLTAFREKFRVEELLVFSTRAWSWSVRSAQATLGAGVISLNRFAGRLSEVSPEEMAELAVVVGSAERALAKAFNYQRINYLMLMMVDHHVHYHMIPRYDSFRQFAGLDWVDTGWPSLPDVLSGQHDGNDAALQQIRTTLIGLL